MEAPRGAGGRRSLLPFEVQLIDQLGISVEEYWQFNDAALERIQERKEGYELIPEIYNEPTTVIAVASLVIGLASTAVGLLMKPKAPRPQSNDNERRNLETGDNIGRSRFNPRYGFDSVQSLATLGKPVPLIFTRRGKFGRNDRNSGGTRVSTQLVWSMIKSGPTNQEVHIAALLGLAEMEWEPEFEGYAIGSTKLEDYPDSKIFLCYNKNGGRPRTNLPDQTSVYEEGKLYTSVADTPNNPLYVNLVDAGTEPAVSGTSTPTTSTQFGVYNFCPSGAGFRLPFSPAVEPTTDFVPDKENRDAIRMEEIKNNFYLYPRGCGFTKLIRNGAEITPGVRDPYTVQGINKGDVLTYTIGTETLPSDDPDKDSMFNNLTTADVNQVADVTRAQSDDILNAGQVYSISNFTARCLRRIDPVGGPYDGKSNRKVVEYEFEALEKGYVKFGDQFRENRTAEDGDNVSRRRDAGAPIYTNGPVDNDGSIKGERQFGNGHPVECSYIAEISDGIVSMSRPTPYVEIGIKSQVWRRIGGPNVSSHPPDEQVDRIKETGGQLTLGQMDRYLKRYSFFRLLFRKGGFGNNQQAPGNPWEPALANNLLFCVEGRSPRDQYNYIKIFIGNANPGGIEPALFDFKLEPVPGAVMDLKIQADPNKRANVALFAWEGNLNTQYTMTNSQLSTAAQSVGLGVAFNGTVRALAEESLEIEDTRLGPLKTQGGRVIELSRYDNGRPLIPQYGNAITKYTDPSQVIGGDQSIPRNKVTRRDVGGGWYTWQVWWEPVRSNDTEPIYEDRLQLSDPSQFVFVEPQTGYRYRPGALQTFNAFPGLNRYEVIREERIPFEPNVFITKSTSRLGGSGTGLTIDIESYQDPNDPDDNEGYYARWEINDAGRNYKTGDVVTFDVRGREEKLTITASGTTEGRLYLRPAINDFPLYEGETISCDTSPEHEIVYINQITNYTGATQPSYERLAYAVLHLQAGREFTSFSDFSGYIKRGIKVNRLITDAVVGQYYSDADKREQYKESNTAPNRLPDRYATNLLPEIATALLADPDLGVGELVGGYQVFYNNMRIAANYCLANGFTWDGIIAERVNLREWIYENAVYNLLDFVIEGGRFGLVPALLYNSTTFKIDAEAKPPIAALFTDGNMKGYKATYLQPEDRQLFTAVVLYRREIGNGFPVTRGVTVNLSPQEGGRSDIDPVEEFDLSDSVTDPNHAIAFAKFALRVRQSVTHTIEFSTTVNEMLGVAPGSYIKVTTEAHYHPQNNNQAQRFRNGSVGPQGQVTSNEDLINKTVDVFYWKSGDGVGVRQGSMTIDSNGITTQAAFFNSVFTVNESNIQARVYRINSIAYGEEGFVDVSATHVPLTSTGALKVADWNDDDFIISAAG